LGKFDPYSCTTVHAYYASHSKTVTYHSRMVCRQYKVTRSLSSPGPSLIVCDDASSFKSRVTSAPLFCPCQVELLPVNWASSVGITRLFLSTACRWKHCPRYCCLFTDTMKPANRLMHIR